jgi:signal transduction histidine kinase
MLGLFAPAVRVMNRLKYPFKFLLVGLLLLIPTIVLLTQYLGSINYDIRFSANEKLGVEYNAPLLELLETINTHGYYAYLVKLGSEIEYADELAVASNEMRDALDAAATVDNRIGSALNVSSRFERTRASVERLLTDLGRMSAAQSNDAHLAARTSVLSLVVVVGNNSNLILDPDIDSYYLMDAIINKLPQVLNYLSQIETVGAAAIEENSLAEDRLLLTLLAENVSSILHNSEDGYEFAYDYNPLVSVPLRPPVSEVFDSTNAFLRNVIRPDGDLGTIHEFRDYSSRVRERLFGLYDLVARELKKLLDTRIAGFEAQRNAVLAIAATAVLASVYFFIGFYLAVRRTIDDLRSTSDNMVSGRLQQSMMFEYRDEFEEVVTAFNNVANEMVAARDRAVKASHLKDEFLATMSHELRTPLNSIIGYTGILMSGMRGSIDETAKGLLGRVRESSQNLLNLINDILDIAKIEAGRMDVTDAPFVLNDLIASLHAQADVLARQKEVNLEVVVDPELPGIVIGDMDKLGQVVRNLLSNAVKFTDEGVVRLRVFGKSETLHFEVSDTGIGIPPQALDYIFDEFRQVDGSTRRVYGGTGLGLAIVRKFCLAMGGRITVQSKLGAGSTFTAIVPLRADVSQAATAVRSAI